MVTFLRLKNDKVFFFLLRGSISEILASHQPKYTRNHEEVAYLLQNICEKCESLKDTHRAKARSIKTPALTKSTNMGIWFVGTSNQLFLRGS